MPRRVRHLLLPLAAIAAVASIAAPAQAAPDLARNFKLSGQPQRIAQGPDGNIWVTISGSSEGNELARIKPSGKLKEFDLPGVTNPTGVGRGKGSLWLTQSNGVVEVPPKSPTDADPTAIGGLTPQEITGGPNDRIYTVSNDQFISFDPNDPAGFTDETIPGMGARGIIGSAGKLWIADFGGQRIVRASPDGLNTKFFNTDGNPRQVAAGANKVVAYTDPGTDPHTVGRIVNNDIKKTKAPNTDATGITKGGDGNWWTANSVSHDIGRLTTGGKYKRFDVLPNNADARYIAAGKNGTLYVALTQDKKVSLIKGVG
jgi:streptogramin lyase